MLLNSVKHSCTDENEIVECQPTQHWIYASLELHIKAFLVCANMKCNSLFSSTVGAWPVGCKDVAHNCMRPAFPAANTTPPLSHAPSTHSRFFEFHELVARQVPDPAVGWKSAQTAELTQSRDSNSTHQHTEKLTIFLTQPQKLVSCREHSVSGKGVIFTAVSTVESQPTWQSVSLLIGLMLGSLLQDFTLRTVIYVTILTLWCLPHTPKPSLFFIFS